MGAVGTGAAVGGVGGAGLGAIVGSIVPGVGTLAGGLVGAYLGAGVGAGAGALMPKEKSAPQLPMPQAPQAPKLEDASDKAQLRADERRRAMARSKSITSNPLGVQDEANVVRKTLLGG